MSETRAEYKTVTATNGNTPALSDALALDEYRRRKRKILLGYHELMTALLKRQLRELCALDREWWQKYPAVMRNGEDRR